MRLQISSGSIPFRPRPGRIPVGIGAASLVNMQVSARLMTAPLPTNMTSWMMSRSGGLKKVTPSTESTRAPRASDASTTEVLDFYALSNYGEARDDNFFVVAETVRNAERPGRCNWKERG